MRSRLGVEPARLREDVVQSVGIVTALSAALIGVQYTYKESHF